MAAAPDLTPHHSDRDLEVSPLAPTEAARGVAPSPAVPAKLLTRWRLAVLGVLLVSALVYVPSLQGAFVWDDPFLVSGSGIGGGRHILHCLTRPFLETYYRPLVSLTFFAEGRLYPGMPFLYHQANVALHVLATGLLVALLLTAFRSRRIALLGGALFAVQPTQVSAVAFIGGRTDSLCTVWVALYGLALVRSARARGRAARVWLAVSASAFALALFSKEQALPLVLLAPLAFRWLAPDRSTRCGWRALAGASVPFALVACAYLWAWISVAPPAAVRPHSLPFQMGEAARTLTYYALLLLAPTPRWIHTISLGGISGMGVWGLAAGVAVLAVGTMLLLRWRRSEPAAAWLLAAAALALVPVSNLVPLPSLQVAPYRAGITGLAVAGLLGWAAVRAIDWLRAASRPSGAPGGALLPARPRLVPAGRAALGTCVVAYVAWCMGLTVWATTVWRDPLTLFTTLTRYDPSSTLAHFDLASTLIAADRPAPAAEHLEATLDGIFGSCVWRSPGDAARAVDAEPAILVRVLQQPMQGAWPRRWLAELFALLGDARIALGRHAEARQAYLAGAAIDPCSAEANRGLGTCAVASHDYEAARRYLLRSLAREQDLLGAHRMLARVYVAQGRLQAARRELAACVSLEPHVCMPYLGLADVQVRLGDRAGAVRTLQAAVRRAALPGHASQMLEDLQAGRAYTGPLPFDDLAVPGGPPAPSPSAPADAAAQARHYCLRCGGAHVEQPQ